MAVGARINPVLVPVGTAALPEVVARQIAQAIRMGLLAPGEQLPAESVLAEHLRISNNTLREAMAQLRTQGLIDTRRGRGGGSFVSEVGATRSTAIEYEIGRRTITELRDLGDEYFAFATTCAYLAAKRADPDNIARIGRHVDTLARSTDVDECARALSQFHVELALATLSERLTRGMIAAQSALGELAWYAASTSRETTAAEIGAVQSAVKGEDPEAAHLAAGEHVERIVRALIGLRHDMDRADG